MPRRIINVMRDLERLAARMVGIGFDGTSIPGEVDALIRRGVRFVIFFSRNVESAEQFAQLAADVKERTAGEPLLTSIDQEGGRVRRLRESFTTVPPMRAVGQADDEKLTYEIGKLLARELRAINIDQDLAPVLDVDTNPNNPVIGPRSLGATPELVARHGVALLRGLQENGVAACGKHFPGHGDTSQDSHHHLPTLNHSLDRLMRVEMPPFEAAIGAGVASIMTAHVIFTPLDAKYPATLSEAVLDGLLRKKLEFDGVVMSDDMQMKAIADNYGFDEAIVRGARAGIDLFWVCHEHALQNRAIDVLIRAVERGELSRSMLECASARIDKLFARFVRPAMRGPLPQWLGGPEHRAIVDEVLRRADADALRPMHDPTEPH
jgi:beta-N-acetylhexosaminidase